MTYTKDIYKKTTQRHSPHRNLFVFLRHHWIRFKEVAIFIKNFLKQPRRGKTHEVQVTPYKRNEVERSVGR